MVEAVSLRSLARNAAFALPWARAIHLVVTDWWCGIRTKRGDIETDSGATHAAWSVSQSLDYIEEVFFDYKQYGGISAFTGTVAEVGPGDNAGVALLLRRDGSQAVHLVDRFVSQRDPSRQRDIYQALSGRHGLDHFRMQDEWNDHALADITWIDSQAAEEYFRDCVARHGAIYDAIISRSVLEHLYDPLNGIIQMAACLKPGGRMIHKVDLRDHGLFTPQHPELTFYRFPTFLYKRMTANSGRPNRILFHRYRDTLEELKRRGVIDYKIRVTRLAGVGDLTPPPLLEHVASDLWKRAAGYTESQRRSFAAELRQVDGGDLAIAGFFLVAIKR
jgi:SAM-dependent methyltransferase